MYFNKYIISEAIKLNNPDDVLTAINKNNAGVKINSKFKEDKVQSYINEKLRLYFRRCEDFGIKEPTYGVQLLLQKTVPYTMEDTIRNDGFFEFLKSYKKPWVKELEEYKELMNSSEWTEKKLHAFEKAVQEGQTKHGKISKGSGQLKDVKTAYDDGTWKLLIPSSFEGEKSAAFYNYNGKETPTQWCTRANKSYYDSYTELGPLYIIRNMSNGKAYQIAFTEHGIDFLDQDDVKGDEITNGDVSKIPDGLLKLIKDHRGERTLYDYKHQKKNIVKTVKGKVSSDEVADSSDFSDAKYGPVKELKNGVCKKEVLNFSNDVVKRDKFQDFFKIKNGKYINANSVIYGKKDKATCYFLKNKPEAFTIYAIGKEYLTNERNLNSAWIIQNRNYQNLSYEEYKTIEDVADEDFGFNKRNLRSENHTSSSKLVEKVNEALAKNKQNFINNVNNSNVLKGTNYTKLLDYKIGKYSHSSHKRIEGGGLISSLGVENKDGDKLLLVFGINTPGTFSYSYYNKAKELTIQNISKREIRDGTKEELAKAKEIASMIMKQIIKLPEYKEANYFRKASNDNIYMSQPEREKNESDKAYERRIKRFRSDYKRKFEMDTNVAFEEVNYFNY